MEPVDYQGMDVAATQVCRGARYQNLWHLSEQDKLKDFSIQFWLYWDALQVATVKVLRLKEEGVAKYCRVIRFTIVPHAIHVQAQCGPEKQWLEKHYNIMEDELDAI